MDLIIAAFNALKQLPELESDLEKYRRDYQSAIQEIERLKKADQKRKEQEQRWLLAQEQVDGGPSSDEK